MVCLPRFKDFRGKVAGGLQAAVQDSPLPNVAADPTAAERGMQTEQQLEAHLDELEKRFATRALAIDAMVTNVRVHELLVPQNSLDERQQRAHELAKRQALDVVVVRHLSRQLQHQTLPDFAGFSKLFATCVASNMGNIDFGKGARDINCYAVCVEGGVHASPPCRACGPSSRHTWWSCRCGRHTTRHCRTSV